MRWPIVIEKDFDVPFIADLALREKQIQQNYPRLFRLIGQILSA